MEIRVKITRTKPERVILLDLEEYLRGVVPSEMPASWPLEALKAQAVAARTYAARRAGKGKGYDLDDTANSQAYRTDYFRNSTDAAIQSTRGQVLCYKGSLIDAVYSSSNPGHTRSAEERWGNAVPYLIRREDPYDTHGGGGHGVGMSQWGARGAAEQGLNYKEILAFYYPGTSLGALSEDSTQGYPKRMEVFTEHSALNLRSAPRGEIIGRIPQGSSVAALREREGWTEVVQMGGEWPRGWCSAAYLKEVKPLDGES